MSERIVVTGVSAWTAFGRGVAPLADALVAGERALRPVSGFSTDDKFFVAKMAMQLPPEASIEASDTGRTRTVSALDWPSAFAVESAVDAWVDAGVRVAGYAPHRIAVLSGSSHGTNHNLLEYLRQKLVERRDPDATLLADSGTDVARGIARRVQARGPNCTINTACSSGLNAIGLGVRLLESGRADCVLAGGHDTFSLLSFAGFTSLKAVDPAGARPFDLGRAGMSLGDGAAYCVLERESSARARSASARAVISGYAGVGEGYHPTAPDPEGRGALQAMSAALANDPNAGELAFISAHGTGTPANDPAEIVAIQTLLQRVGAAGPVRVSSLKGSIGHTLGATGALQMVAAIEHMRRGVIPPTTGLRDPVPHAPPIELPMRAVSAPIPLALCNAFGFAGSVASLALRRFEG